MRIAAKSTILMVILYLIGLAAAGLWLEKDYRRTTEALMSDTATLVSRQIAASLHEPVVDQLFKLDEDAFQTLSDIVETTVDRSELVKSLAVVDRSGELVVGGREYIDYPTPEAKFGDDNDIQVISQFEGRFSAGRHIAFIPILKKSAPVGYLKITLGNKRIDLLFDSLAGQLVNFALVGIFAILALGGLLHVELSRLGREVIGLMRTGDPVRKPRQRFGNDEFHAVRTEAQLLGARSKQSIEDLGTLTRALKVGLILVDKQGEPVFVSKNASELLHAETSNSIPDSFEEPWNVILGEITKMFADETRSRVVTVNTEISGGTKTLEFELLRSSDSTEQTLALVRDKDTMLALDENLRAATRMHTLSSIYLGAAHDLRAPISAMVMNLELLEQSVIEDGSVQEEKIDGDRSRYITILKDELNRLQRFLDSFLSTATVDRSSGRDAIELTTIVEDLVRLFATQAKQLGISIDCQFPETSVYVHAAGDQLRQVIMNVIVNAFESMPDGGELRVAVTTESGNVLVSIKDSGPGIPSTLLDRVFDMHFTTKSTGTGIGLYVAKSVIEQHGGKMTVSSALGEGTEFTVALPLHFVEDEETS